jgi:hypothetical protein
MTNKSKIRFIDTTSIPKPQKIAYSNFLDFKDWQQLKSAFFGGPGIFELVAIKESLTIGFLMA